MNNYVGIIVAFITGVLGPVVVILVKNWLGSRKQKPDIVKEALKVSELVNHKLDEIREEFNADRVWITQFHNGGNFYPTGKSIAKFSVIYETVNQDVTSIQTNFRNIPVNLFSKSINQLLENNKIVIPDYKDVTIATYGLKYVAESTSCKSGYLFAIKTIDDKFIATLGLDYTKKIVSLTDHQIIELEKQASILSGVLMTY
jgi:hypothetical protein